LANQVQKINKHSLKGWVRDTIYLEFGLQGWLARARLASTFVHVSWVRQAQAARKLSKIRKELNKQQRKEQEQECTHDHNIQQ
jgi:hypothetical protein